MHVAILTSTLGFGHLRAAQAVEQALREREPSVDITLVDVWSLMDAAVAAAGREGYLRGVVEQPAHYERLFRFNARQWRAFFRDPDLPSALRAIITESLDYWFPGHGSFPARGANLDQTLFLNLFLTLTTRRPVPGNLIRRALVVWMHALLCRRLRQRLQRLDVDLVVATQMMPAALFAAVRRRGELADVPVLAVLTDYGVHDFWLRPNIDHYCVATTDMAADLRARGMAETPVSVTGMPLMAGFRDPLPQDMARARLGLDPERTTVLITGGGYGIGTAEATAEVLRAGPDCQVLLAAGQERVNSRLAELADARPDRIRLFQQDLDMPALVRAADLVIGKPGGLSVSEALACGRPFLAICSLGGQESFNVALLERYGVGERVPAGELGPVLEHWLSDRAMLARCQARAWELGARHGAERVAARVLQLAGYAAGGERHEEQGS